MNKELFSKVNGKQITVYNLDIIDLNDALCAKLGFVTEDENVYMIVFENVSKIKLSDISYPFRICGFEIVDNGARGYQGDSRFFVNDYEDGRLSFFCESFEICCANGRRR